MCGIYGFSGHQIDNPEFILKQMGESLSHRGPDDSGTFNYSIQQSSIYFGHRRLSIIDLDHRSSQPMSSSCGNVVIVFNGEIYNYLDLKYKTPNYNYLTESDTEVIIALYLEFGVDMVKMLNGIFSFALFDTRSNVLFLIRDRIGVKPLFYTIQNDNLIFSSEVTAITKFPGFKKEINPIALELFLALKYVPGELTIFNGIKKVPPGTVLSFNKSIQLSKWTYFSFSFIEDLTISFEDIYSEIENSINRNLVSDVEVVSLLSSGVDSSLVTLIASKKNFNLKSYTMGLSHFGVDESKQARKFAFDIGIETTQNRYL